MGLSLLLSGSAISLGFSSSEPDLRSEMFLRWLTVRGRHLLVVVVGVD